VLAAAALPSLLSPGDVLVVNDAATLPASIPARTSRGEPVEIRLVGARDGGPSTEPLLRFTAALLGAGDHVTRTEDRPPPPRIGVAEVLAAGPIAARVVRVSSFSERLVDLDLSLDAGEVASPGALLAALYRVGRPIQYAHVPRPLALWDVQNAWASRPWAVEMPSAGRVIRVDTLRALRGSGVAVATVTHAAGLSATGDPAIDLRLPLPERFEVPAATARAVENARTRGGRVVAVGTSVVRALESAAAIAGRGPLRAASGITDLKLGPESARALVDGILTGVHEAGTSHFALLGAFADPETLERANAAATQEGLVGHEFGDAWLVWGPRAARSATFAA